ncbi:hypothetical protein CQZ94_09805 [Bacillus sp. MYb209]|nr:hypothetical protein CQZ94_09805 [Bacillus sp. MYb209]
MGYANTRRADDIRRQFKKNREFNERNKLKNDIKKGDFSFTVDQKVVFLILCPFCELKNVSFSVTLKNLKLAIVHSNVKIFYISLLSKHYQ